MTNDIPELPPLSSASALFCYACNVDDIYYRHAFCIFNGHIIEPLPHIAKGLRVERIIPIRDVKANEYFTHAVKDERFDLFPSLLQDEIAAFNENEILATHLNPVDMGELVRTVANTIDDYHRIMSGIQAGQGLPGNTHTQQGVLGTL